MASTGGQAARLDELQEALLAVDRISVRRLVTGGEGGPPSLMTMEGLVVPVLERIGRGWEEGRIALAQVYMSGRLCEELVDSMEASAAPTAEGSRIAVAVLEDSHLLGQRLVYSALRVAGYSVRKYGSLALEPLVKRVCEEGIGLLLVSVLMLPSALRVRALTDRLRRVSPNTRVVVGGAPFRFDLNLWREVGAHDCGQAASDAIRIVKSFVGGRP